MRRALAVTGTGAVVLNIAAVVALRNQPHAYRPQTVPLWLQEVWAHPTDATVSAFCFVLGLVLLTVFCALLVEDERSSSRDAPGLRVGLALVGLGALLDAAGCAGVVGVAWQLRAPALEPAAMALLTLTLQLDAAFNLLLGLGLCTVAISATHWKKWLRALWFLGGVTSIPVMSQAWSDQGADLLAVAGPLWLSALLATAWISRRA